MQARLTKARKQRKLRINLGSIKFNLTSNLTCNMYHIYRHLHEILWVESLKRLKHSQLSLRRTPLGPAISVCLGESHIKGVKKERDQR